MLSKSALNRVGKRLRDAETPDPEDVAAYAEYQAEFREPVRRVATDLFDSIHDLHVLRFSTRLKKLESVIAKLRRHDTQLATIEDIGGIRLVVPTLDEVEIAEAELAGYDIVRRRDYREESNKGYRALHLIIRMSARHRIELQIRTQIQNEWANTSEKLYQKLDQEVKYGGGPNVVRTALDDLSNNGREIDISRTTWTATLQGSLDVRRDIEFELLGGWPRTNDLSEAIKEYVEELPETELLVYAVLSLFRAHLSALEREAEGE